MDDELACFTIKCGLGRLKPAQPVRAAIEDVVEKIHAIALRGSYVATEAWLAASQDALPTVDQTWWNRCFSSTYASPSRKKRENPDEGIVAAHAKLFSTSSRIQGDRLWAFVAELARDAMTATHNMVASTFHKQVQKALRREVLLYEVSRATALDRNDKWKAIQHYFRRAVGHCGF